MFVRSVLSVRFDIIDSLSVGFVLYVAIVSSDCLFDWIVLSGWIMAGSSMPRRILLSGSAQSGFLYPVWWLLSVRIDCRQYQLYRGFLLFDTRRSDCLYARLLLSAIYDRSVSVCCRFVLSDTDRTDPVRNRLRLSDRIDIAHVVSVQVLLSRFAYGPVLSSR